MKLKKAVSFSSENYKEPILCEACGADFTCGASDKGCWCMNVELNDEARAELKSKFNDCLCPDCLEKLAKTTA